jgi:hypothetical protein
MSFKTVSEDTNQGNGHEQSDGNCAKPKTTTARMTIILALKLDKLTANANLTSKINLA